MKAKTFDHLPPIGSGLNRYQARTVLFFSRIARRVILKTFGDQKGIPFGGALRRKLSYS